MNEVNSRVPGNGDDEVTALIGTLTETERRLEALTAGEVDTVADSYGRTFLLRRAQERLRASEAAKQAAILNALPAHIALLDSQGTIISVNEAWRQFGSPKSVHGPGHPIGLNYLALCDSAPEATSSDTRQVAKGIRSVLIGAIKSYSIEYRHDSATEQQWFLLTVTPLVEDRRNGAVVTHLNITEEKRAKDELRELILQISHSAQHDFLTGLPNRMLLNDRINQAIALAKRHQTKLAVLFLDMDGFKHTNDSLGHPVGDRLLQSIAKRLVACVRDSDTVSRQGGDEFVVLLSETEGSEGASTAATRIAQGIGEVPSIDQHDLYGHVDAAMAAGRILRAVADVHSVEQHDLHITASIGISIYPDDGLDAETLLRNADTAMYQAKENGAQRFQFFTPSMNVRAVERQSIEGDMRRALQRGEFTLHYQPVINMRTGAITGAEALIRWTHPTRGTVPPLQFIPVAEDSGLILPIGAWVLREACTQARAWVDAGLPRMTVAVNVSAVEFRNENFLENVFTTLSETGLDPRLLELELTESVLMKRVESSASILQSLRERGVHVSIDDFGTGYSSLSYLRKFPVDALKIDQSFVRRIGTDAEDRAIVSAVIGMAQSLNLRVIAEGVETLEELTFLRSHHCDEAQGYYFSKPVPPEQFAQLLRNGI
jgi:diguanylate cyclase (GGDEF)-like protein